MKNAAKTALLLAAMSALLLLIGDALGGTNGLVIAFGFAVLMNFGSYWFSDKIVLAMYRAKPVGADHPVHRLVWALRSGQAFRCRRSTSSRIRRRTPLRRGATLATPR